MPISYADPGTSVTMEGWLEKQRKLKTWVWKPYWFCLEGDQLAYYKGQQVKNLIKLNQITRIIELPMKIWF